MKKVIQDRLNHLRSELQTLKQPKLGKRGEYYVEKTKELEYRIEELNFIYQKSLKYDSK